jgi:hypothetical protein
VKHGTESMLEVGLRMAASVTRPWQDLISSTAEEFAGGNQVLLTTASTFIRSQTAENTTASGRMGKKHGRGIHTCADVTQYDGLWVAGREARALHRRPWLGLSLLLWPCSKCLLLDGPRRGGGCSWFANLRQARPVDPDLLWLVAREGHEGPVGAQAHVPVRFLCQ